LRGRGRPLPPLTVRKKGGTLRSFRKKNVTAGKGKKMLNYILWRRKKGRSCGGPRKRFYRREKETKWDCLLTMEKRNPRLFD